MESKWRLNVATMGLVGTDVRLIARFTNPTILNFHLGTASNPFVAGIWQWPDPDQLPTLWGSVSTFGRNFPYGYEVEPDR